MDYPTFPVDRRGQGGGVAKACAEQAAADSQGSRTCVCANTFDWGVALAGVGGGGERGGRMKKHPAVVPSSRRGNTSSESQRRENRAARKANLPTY